MLTQWEKVKAGQRMQDFIEQNLENPITMAALAKAAHYSQWHAGRVFKELTGKSPFEYVRSRRLSAAATRLGESDSRVLDVALDFVFDSHEGFTRAFVKEFGVPPNRFRKTKPAVSLFLPPRLRDWYQRRQSGDIRMSETIKTVPVFVQVLERPARKLIVKRAKQATHYFEYCEEVGCQVWEQLAALKETLHEPMGLWLPERFREAGTSTYVQGVEVATDYAGPVPEGFEVVDLPACKMLVFQGPPFEDKDFEKAIESLWDVMNSYQPETFGLAWADEEGPRFQLQPLGYRGYIEGRPVRSRTG